MVHIAQGGTVLWPSFGPKAHLARCENHDNSMGFAFFLISEEGFLELNP